MSHPSRLGRRHFLPRDLITIQFHQLKPPPPSLFFPSSQPPSLIHPSIQPRRAPLLDLQALAASSASPPVRLRPRLTTKPPSVVLCFTLPPASRSPAPAASRPAARPSSDPHARSSFPLLASTPGRRRHQGISSASPRSPASSAAPPELPPPTRTTCR